MDKGSEKLSRRDFLRLSGKMAAAALTGGITTEALLPAKFIVNDLARGANAKEGKDTSQVDKTSIPSLTFFERLQSAVFAPLLEEGAIRALPSFILSSESSLNPMKEVFEGTGGIKLSRREVIVGGITSIAFGFLHNLDERGDTRIIPASQILSGGVYWYLQRKLGLPANLVAHSWSNLRVAMMIDELNAVRK